MLIGLHLIAANIMASVVAAFLTLNIFLNTNFYAILIR